MPDIIIHDMTIDNFADYDEDGIRYLIGTGRVDEVKHGHWEYIGGYGYQYRCNKCFMCGERKTNYCPHCGAKMDEVDND